MKLFRFNIPVLCMCLFLLPALTSAVEVAPRVTDREIIESLAGIKAKLATHDQRFDAMEVTVNQRFDAVSQRFDDMNKRIDDLSIRISAQTEQMNGIQNTMIVLFGAIISLIIAMFGYIAWDRQTMMQPMRERIETLENTIQRDLDLDHVDGSRMKRLLAALQELSKTDAKLATVLRNFSLL